MKGKSGKRPPRRRDTNHRRRGLRELPFRLTQEQLVGRAARTLRRATEAVERAPKGERKALQERLAVVRRRIVVQVGEDWFVRGPRSKR